MTRLGIKLIIAYCLHLCISSGGRRKESGGRKERILALREEGWRDGGAWGAVRGMLEDGG